MYVLPILILISLPEAVTLAEKAFSDAPNDYDIELINELKKTDVT